LEQMGCNSSTIRSGSTPHLDAYFLEYAAMLDDACPGDDPFEMLMDQRKMAAVQKKSEKHKKKMEEALRRSFALHDKNKDGILNQEESAVFFDHFVEKYGKFQATAMVKAADKVGAMGMHMGAMFGDEGDEMMKGMQTMMQQQMKEQTTEVKKEADRKIQERMKSYNKNPAAKHASAFKVVDVNKDKKLQVEEVVKCCMPDSTENGRFLVALGMMDEQEARAAATGRNAIGARAMGGAEVQAECNQQ